MELAVSTNILFERKHDPYFTIWESLDLLAQSGYRNLDLCFVDLVTAKTEFITEKYSEYLLKIKEFAQERDINFCQAHAPIDDFCNGGTSLELVQNSVRGCNLLNCKNLVIHPSTKVTNGTYDELTFEENVKYFQNLARFAQDFDTNICIENMWSKTREGVERRFKTASELVELIQVIGEENVFACWDTQHAGNEELDQYQEILTLGGYLQALHISDYTSAEHIHILPYQGKIVWEPIFKALVEINYSGYFTYEMQHYFRTQPKEFAPIFLELSKKIGYYMIEQIGNY